MTRDLSTDDSFFLKGGSQKRESIYKKSDHLPAPNAAVTSTRFVLSFHRHEGFEEAQFSCLWFCFVVRLVV